MSLPPLSLDQSTHAPYYQRVSDLEDQIESSSEDPIPSSESTVKNSVVRAILDRPDNADERYKHLDKINQAIQSKDDMLITKELKMAEHIMPRVYGFPDASMDSKEQADMIEEGFRQIRELDALFMQKNSVAKSLKRERIDGWSGERQAEMEGHPRKDLGFSSDEEGTRQELEVLTPGKEEDEVDCFEDDGDETQSLELKSVHSLQRQTFLTEPRLGARQAIGREALLAKSGCLSTVPSLPSLRPGATKVHLNPHPPHLSQSTKSYEPGNFIQRNIALGGASRFYTAMSEAELARVDAILQELDPQDYLPDIQNCPFTHSSTSRTVSRNSSYSGFYRSEAGNVIQARLGTGFLPSEVECQTLDSIDRKLQSILPESEWEIRSTMGNDWFPDPQEPDDCSSQISAVSSLPCHTPSGASIVSEVDVASSVVSQRTVEEILNDTPNEKAWLISWENDANKQTLSFLEEQLKQLEQRNNSPLKLTRGQMDVLLTECAALTAELAESEVIGHPLLPPPSPAQDEFFPIDSC